MRLDVVRSCLIVVEEGSLNRAAARLRLAQSSFTRQVQGLHALSGSREEAKS